MEIVAVIVTGIVAYVFGRLQAEHQVRFTRIYEERATVVAHLYKLVMEAEMSLKQWSYPFGTGKQEEREDAVTRFRALLDYYRANSIWLDQRTCDTLDSLVKETYNLFSDMDVLADPNEVRREWNLPEDPAERAKIREDITHRALEKIPTTREY